MRLHQVTPPEVEPVSLAEAKDHLRLEHDLDDAYVAACIQAARQYAEEICWRRLVAQTWEAVLDGFPCGDAVELRGGNLRSVESVTFIDQAGVSRQMDPELAVEDKVSLPGRLVLAYGKQWPAARRQWDAVRIRYVVGWEPAEVPGPIKQALLLMVSHFYEQRSPEITGAPVGQLAFSIDALLRPYRLVRY